jgi:hypothetical protein
MHWSLILCLGSTLAALFGLLALNGAVRRERWRGLWLLVAAALLIGAGFGTAETVYQLSAERAGGEGGDDGSPARPPPTATPLPSPTPQPLSPSSPTPRPTLPILPTPAPTVRPTAAPVVPPSTPPGDAGALAPSLIASEREALAALDDPPHYTLDVRVDFEALTVAGTVEILYTNNEREALEAIYLRLYPNAEHYEEGETRIDAVNVDGVAADFGFEDQARTVLVVPLPAPLPPKAQSTLQIAFSVSVPRRSDRFGYDEGVMSLGHWYPMLAVYDDEGWNRDPYVALGDAFYSDVAFFTVHLTVPEDAVVAATGVEVGQVLHRPPRATITYVSGATRDFALALSREYEAVSAQVGETTVTSYYLPGHEQGGQQALQVAADALEVYNARFGLYPYTELDVAETAFVIMGSPGGMEFPGIVFISSEFYRPGSFFASEMDTVVAHEVAHQWWYGVVGNNQVDEPWLDEAFATYASIVYFEDAQDDAAAEAALWSQAVLPYQLGQMLGGDGPLQRSLLDYDGNLLIYQPIVYGKGALFLARLRELLGDDEFFALMQHHYQAHKYGLLAADDFRHSIQDATGNAEALEFYDAVVVRGEAIEGLETGLQGLEGLLGGELSPEELENLLQLFGELLQDVEP